MRKLVFAIQAVIVLLVLIWGINKATAPRFSCRLCKPVQISSDSRLAILMINEGRLSMIDLHPEYTWVNGKQSDHYGYIQLFQAGEKEEGSRVKVRVNPEKAKAEIEISLGDNLSIEKAEWKKYYCSNCCAQLEKLGSILDAVLIDKNSNQVYRMDEEGEFDMGSYKIQVTAVQEGYQVKINE